jgi:hypothetical protein
MAMDAAAATVLVKVLEAGREVRCFVALALLLC